MDTEYPSDYQQGKMAMAGAGAQLGQVATGSPKLKQRLEFAVADAEKRLSEAKEARDILSRNPDLERLLDIMQKGRFLILLCLLMFGLTACDGSPTALATSPTSSVLTANDVKTLKSTSSKSSSFSSIGRSTTVNTSGERACFWYSAWDASKDEVNQTFIKGDINVVCVNPGETAEGWIAFDETPYCKMQGDWFKFPLTTTAPPPGPTLNALANYFWDAKGGQYYKGGGCNVPPTTPPQPPPPPPPPPTPPIPPVCMAKGVYDFPAGVSTIAQFPASYSGPHFLPESLPLRPMSIPIMGGVPVMITVVTQDDHAKEEASIQTGEQDIPLLSPDGVTVVALAATLDVPDTGMNPDVRVTVYGPITFPETMGFIGANHGGPVPVLGEIPTNSVTITSVTWTCAAPVSYKTAQR